MPSTILVSLLPAAQSPPKPSPTPLPRVAQHYRSKEPVAPPPQSTMPPSEWLSTCASLARAARSLEVELAGILQAHSERRGAAAEGVPWAELLHGLTATERLASAERQQLGREVAGLRAGGPAASAALKEFRERQRQAYGALCGEERSAASAVSAKGISDLLAALEASAAASASSARAVGGGGSAQEGQAEAEAEGEEEEEEEEKKEESEEKAAEEGAAGTALPASASPASPSPAPPPTGSLQHLQARLLAVKGRVEALDAECAREAHGGAMAYGWDALDKAKGGAEDLATLASMLSKYLASKEHLQQQKQVEGGAEAASQRLLAEGEMQALGRRAAAILPGRSAPAISGQLAHLLRGLAARSEKLAAVAEWKSLRGSLEAAARRALGGGGGGGGGEGGLNASFASSPSSASATSASASRAGWRGPDALTRIAVVEWRAGQAAAKAAAQAEAEAEAARAQAAAAAARAARVSAQKAQLSRWAEGEGEGEGGEALGLQLLAGGGGVGPIKAHHLRAAAEAAAAAAAARASQAPPPTTQQLLARSSGAIAAAAAARAARVQAQAAAAAAASERRGDARVAEQMARVAAGRRGERSSSSSSSSSSSRSPDSAASADAAASNTSASDSLLSSYAFPERATTASGARALSRRQLREQAAQRGAQQAHEARVASVIPGARGKSFGVGSMGALPSRATPSWRKGL